MKNWVRYEGFIESVNFIENLNVFAINMCLLMSSLILREDLEWIMDCCIILLVMVKLESDSMKYWKWYSFLWIACFLVLRIAKILLAACLESRKFRAHGN